MAAHLRKQKNCHSFGSQKNVTASEGKYGLLTEITTFGLQQTYFGTENGTFLYNGMNTEREIRFRAQNEGQNLPNASTA